MSINKYINFSNISIIKIFSVLQRKIYTDIKNVMKKTQKLVCVHRTVVFIIWRRCNFSAQFIIIVAPYINFATL